MVYDLITLATSQDENPWTVIRKALKTERANGTEAAAI